MAVRREKVVLELQDDFSNGMLRAAASTKVAQEELKRLDGQNIRTTSSMRDVEHGAGNLGSAFRRASNDTNFFTRGLQAARAEAKPFGGALVVAGVGLAAFSGPLAAGAIAGISGISSAMAVGVTSIGVFKLAMQGVIPAVQALDNYRQNPSKSTLKALQNQMQDLTPAAQHFVYQLEAMRPALDRMRQAAASGLFPGLTEALKTLETRGPQINGIIHQLALGMGDLSRQGAKALAGPGWDNFFKTFRADAKPMIIELGQALGNLAQAGANLWTAFAPFNLEFGKGLVDLTAKFDRWTAGLSKTEGFQHFVDYMKTNGPILLQTIGSLANAFISIAATTAPIGGPLLQALGQIANLTAAIAKDDVGKDFVEAAAAAVVINKMLSPLGGFKGIGTGLKAALGKAGASSLAGEIGSMAKPVPVYVTNEGWGKPGGGGGGLTGGAATAGKGGIAGKIEGATNWFGNHPIIAGATSVLGVAGAAAVTEEVTRRVLIPEFKQSMINYQTALGLGANGGGRTGKVGVQDSRTPLQNQVAGAFTNYNIASGLGLLPGYKSQGFPGVFDQATNKFTVDTKKAAAELHAVGVALSDIHVKASKPVKVTADTKDAKSKLREIDAEKRQTATPVTVPVRANTSAAQAAVRNLALQISGLGGLTPFLPPAFGGTAKKADGGQVLGPRYPYGDKVLTYLAPGEEVISNRYGQADRFRADRAAGRIPGYANGGTIQALASGGTATLPGYAGMWLRANSDSSLAQQFYNLSAALNRVTVVVTRETNSLNALKSSQDALRQNIISMFTGNPWQNLSPWAAGGGTGSVFTTLQTDINNANSFNRLGKSLMKRGLHGAALDAAESSGLNALRSLSSLSKHDLQRYQSMFDARTRAAGVAAATAAASYNGEISHANHILALSLAQQRQTNARLLKVEDAIKQQGLVFGKQINRAAALAARKAGH